MLTDGKLAFYIQLTLEGPKDMGKKAPCAVSLGFMYRLGYIIKNDLTQIWTYSVCTVTVNVFLLSQSSLFNYRHRWICKSYLRT